MGGTVVLDYEAREWWFVVVSRSDQCSSGFVCSGKGKGNGMWRRWRLGQLLVLVALGMCSWATATATAQGDINSSVCANESFVGFRPYLADCRAYELVTPVFKAGSGPTVKAVSADGQSQIIEATGAIAGTKGDPLTAYYQATRGASDWTAWAIAADASQFPASKLFAASDDLRRTLWATRGQSQSIYAKDLYIRERDGRFVEVGPMAPPFATGGPPAGALTSLSLPYELAGASPDLSHVYFSTLYTEGGDEPGELWPGDTTAESGIGLSGGNSLYEYAGTGNTAPTLVGVSDGRTTRGEQLLPRGTLISSCSTFLGSESSLDAYNAVSDDGNTVYFTARGHNVSTCENVDAPDVSEVYARVSGAATVPISEPKPGQCASCRTEVRRPAEFQGASSDGAKAFFTTEQELLPGLATTNLYEYDFDEPVGERVVQVSTGSTAPEVEGVARVSEDGSHVYFVARGRLTRGPRAGAHGTCLASLSLGEAAEEAIAEEEEEEGKAASGGRCRPREGADNLYVFDRDTAHPHGHIAFVATLSPADEQTDWKNFQGDARAMNATPEGRFLVFSSAGDLTAGDTSSERQIFEYDAATEELVRVSVGQAGYPAGNAHADVHSSAISEAQYIGPFAGGSLPTARATNLAVSDDGSTVVFASRAALTQEAEPAEAAEASSVYEYRSAGAISRGDVYLVSGAGETLSAGLPAISASGSDIFFGVASGLVPEDVDTQFDYYDARQLGGHLLAETAPPCKGEACLGPMAASEQNAAPTSTAVASVLGSGSSLFSGTSPPAPDASAGSKPGTRTLTSAQRLMRALKACRRRHGRGGRAACEKHARRQYRKARTGRETGEAR